MRLWVWSLALLSGLRIGCCHELWVGCRHGSDPALLWLWHRPAATALIGPLAWEPPYAAEAALEKQKDKKKKIYMYKWVPPFMLLFLFLFMYLFFWLFRAVPSLYGGSPARDPVRAVAAGLCQSHSKAGTEECLQPTAQLMATPDPP